MHQVGAVRVPVAEQQTVLALQVHIENTEPARVREPAHHIPGEQRDPQNRESAVLAQFGELVPAAQYDRKNIKPGAEQEDHSAQPVLQQHIYYIRAI